MLKELSEEQLNQFNTITNQWLNRTYNYYIKNYKRDCTKFISQLCKAVDYEMPVLVFLDSPLA